MEMPSGAGEREPGEIRTMPGSAWYFLDPSTLFVSECNHLEYGEGPRPGSISAVGQREKPRKGCCTLESFFSYYPVSQQTWHSKSQL